jgi:hypothetical protein
MGRPMNWMLAPMAAMALALAACGGEDDGEQAQTTTEEETAPTTTPEQAATGCVTRPAEQERSVAEKDRRTPERDLPEANGQPPTTNKLAGLWFREGTTLLLRFSPDCTFAIDDGGVIDTAPAGAGTYEVDGRTINFESSGSEICTEGDRWAWEVGIPGAGQLQMVSVNDAAGECSIGIGTKWTFARVPSSCAEVPPHRLRAVC